MPVDFDTFSVPPFFIIDQIRYLLYKHYVSAHENRTSRKCFTWCECEFQWVLRLSLNQFFISCVCSVNLVSSRKFSGVSTAWFEFYIAVLKILKSKTSKNTFTYADFYCESCSIVYIKFILLEWNVKWRHK